MPLNAEQFSLFLYGFSETNSTPPTPAQWAVIQQKLNGVFNKVTPHRHPDHNDLASITGEEVRLDAPSGGDMNKITIESAVISC